MPGHRISLVWPSDPTIYASRKYRRACRYEAFVPDRLASLRLAVDTGVAGLVSEAEHALRDLNARAHPALGPLARLLLRTESIASSKIEGVHLTARNLARAEARAEMGTSPAPTAREIIANIDAMELAVKRGAGAPAFTVANVTAIHRRLMKHSPTARFAGKIRTEQNWIGGNDHNPCGADFVPPPPRYVRGLLADLCAALNNDALPPILQAALVHAQFETIHPFADGNGRAGRALIHVVLRRRGVAPAYVPPISVVLSESRDRYVAGLTRFRADDVTRWIEHFAAAATSAARLAQDYVGAVESLVERWRARLAEHAAPRADAAAWAVIDLLPAHPIITANAILAKTGRARAAVYQAVEHLVDAGVLVPAAESRRGQMWEAKGLLDLITRLEAGERPLRGTRAKKR